MGVTAKDVKELREATGAGMMDCKKALQECDGDFDKAANWLREKGIASAAKRQDREAKEGSVASYIHMGGKIGVLVEVNCETDFVARGELFQEFCKNVCLQICSTAPRWVRRDEATPEEIEAEKAIYAVQAKESGRPETVQQKIVEGKLNKWLKENSLLDQEFVKNPDVTIEELMKELSGKIGEKIDIRRFARFQLGEAIDGRKPAGDEE
ncbi:MAG TPA: translation elongation factor Ts [Candidatus Hydrogenedentes bacterium]|nr:translation elongation factor Ts [Candidatus Hydrogenedentota bacterium]HQH52426.1 translation elongation factor Ts [Candidatus Hydrogenedentota bacterium]HQM47653.1 translation elongation factor Ts [Candidatus Hydrogenedentota bacterium]